jgi:cbb3-type cytochrome oxidase maturation protein
MSAIFVLIGVSLVVAIGFLIAFLWSVKSGQYEDEYTPSVRILFEDKPGNQDPAGKTQEPKTKETRNQKSKTKTNK